MLWKGLRFGMILQLAVGPICILVLNTSVTYGFIYGLIVVLAVTLIDALYIALSCLGIASIINSARIKAGIKIIGCLVLIIYGLNIIISVFALYLLPEISIFSNINVHNIFIQGLLLTASNPLTIIFWGGVLSTQMLDNHWHKKELILFVFGCILSTLIFLILIALLGSIFNYFLTSLVSKILNVIVGVVLIIFGVRLLVLKDKSQKTSACS